MSLILNEEHVKSIEAYLGEVPMKWSGPLINYLATVKQEQEAAKASKKTPTPDGEKTTKPVSKTKKA